MKSFITKKNKMRGCPVKNQNFIFYKITLVHGLVDKAQADEYQL